MCMLYGVKPRIAGMELQIHFGHLRLTLHPD